jgi:hypothetical protein
MRQHRDSADDASTSSSAADHVIGRRPLTGVLQRKGGAGGGASSQDIAAAGFDGPAMSLPYRSEMESGFGVSFSGVTAYGGGAAADANAALGSQAYAVGQQIAFADASPAREVVAHELAHTIQQGDAGPVQTWSEGSPGDAYEQEADAAAATVLSGGQAQVSMRTGPSIQKWGGEDHYAIGNLAGQKATRGLPDRPSIHTSAAVSGVFAGGDVTQAPSQGVGGLSTAGETTETRSIGVAHADPSRGPGGVSTATTGDASRVARVTTDGGEVSFGALTRAGGDYFRTPGEMAGMSRENDIPSNWGSLGSLNLPPGNDFGALADIGTTNANHFYPLNRNEYRNHHQIALQKAAAGDERGALMEEGFASHFLMDTFSAGHMAPRSLDSIGALQNPDALNHALTADAMGRGLITAAQAGVEHYAGAVAGAATEEAGRRFDASVEGGANAGEAAGDSMARWIGDVLGSDVTIAGYDINPISGEVVAEYTGVVTRAGGRAVGTLGGGIVGIGTGAGGLVEGGYDAATSPTVQGASVQAGAEAAMGRDLYQDAFQGLTRTKDWHDFFCALPDGLPTDKGRFHGDHLMDGNDLEHVSNVCAGSLRQVLCALPNPDGTPGPSYSYDAGSQMPTPAFSQIMEDPVAGPAWRLMMQEYRADMARANQEVTDGTTSRTDGGTDYDSREVVDLIYQNVFGGSLDAPELRAGHVNQERANVYHALLGVQHFLDAAWGANAQLGMNDDLNRPMNRANPAWQATHDRDASYVGGYGAGEMQDGRSLARFNPELMNRRYGMFQGLVDSCGRWVEACNNAQANHDVLIPGEKELATSMQAQAQALHAQAQALPRLGDSVSLIDGAQGMGASFTREMAGFMMEHGMADAASTVWEDGAGRAFRDQARPILEGMVTRMRALDPQLTAVSVGPSAEAAAAAQLH